MARVSNDYDCEFHYHLGKANKVINALSRKPTSFAIEVEGMPKRLQADLCNLEIEVIIGKLSALTIQPTIMEAIKGDQMSDPQIEGFKQAVLERSHQIFSSRRMECWVIKEGGFVCRIMRRSRNRSCMKLTIPLIQCTQVPQRCIET